MSVDVLERSSPAVDTADTAEREYPLYPCGTVAPGLVHDPCQHSLVIVQCCSCAGCAMDQWFCGTMVRSGSYLWWEAESIAARFDPWVRHRYAPVFYALLVILAVSTNVVVDLVELVFKMELILSVVLWVTLTSLLN